MGGSTDTMIVATAINSLIIISPLSTSINILNKILICRACSHTGQGRCRRMDHMGGRDKGRRDVYSQITTS